MEKKCAAIPILGLSHFQSKGAPQPPHEPGHPSPLDAAVSFVSQFTDHYNPQNQLQNAKSFLNRVKASTADPAAGMDDAKLPLPSIGNALLSAGLESGLLKSLAQKPMQPFQSTTRHGPTSHNISNGSTTNQFDARKATTNSSTPSNVSSERSHREDDRKRLRDIEISMAVPMAQKQPSNLKAAREGTNQNADTTKFSQANHQTVLDDHFDQYQSKEEATKVPPSAKSPPSQTSNPSSQVVQPKLSEPTGSPWELYQHQQQLQLQLQQQQQFFEQQVLLQEQQHHNDNRFSSDRPFSYDNPRGLSGQNPDFYDQVDQGSHQHQHGQTFIPTPSSYERRQTLPPGQLEEVIKTSLFQEPKVPLRQKEAPAAMKPSFTPKPAREAMGSMPDVSRRKNRAHEEPAMPREEVHVMSMRRREEIRKLREEEERRRQQELVLSFGEFRVRFSGVSLMIL